MLYQLRAEGDQRLLFLTNQQDQACRGDGRSDRRAATCNSGVPRPASRTRGRTRSRRRACGFKRLAGHRPAAWCSRTGQQAEGIPAGEVTGPMHDRAGGAAGAGWRIAWTGPTCCTWTGHRWRSRARRRAGRLRAADRQAGAGDRRACQTAATTAKQPWAWDRRGAPASRRCSRTRSMSRGAGRAGVACGVEQPQRKKITLNGQPVSGAAARVLPGSGHLRVVLPGLQPGPQHDRDP